MQSEFFFFQIKKRNKCCLEGDLDFFIVNNLIILLTLVPIALYILRFLNVISTQSEKLTHVAIIQHKNEKN